MKIASWVKSKDCWAFEKAGEHAEIGWEKELNGSVITEMSESLKA